MKDYIKGHVSKIIFQSDSGYIVGIFRIKEGFGMYESLSNSSISFTGYFHELNLDDNYYFFGNIVKHPKYGEQLSVSKYERVKPEEKDSIIEFLSSGLFKGIGEKTAEKIVDVLGNNALKIIIETPDNLLLIPSITKKQRDTIYNTLVEYESSYNTILNMNKLGFNTKDAMTIYNRYKTKTNSIIEDDLYRIYFDIKEIGFKKIDSIALKSNYDRKDNRRIKACIVYTMEELTNLVGHCYFSIKDIYKYTIMYLGNNLSEEEFVERLNELIIDIRVIKDNDKYYLNTMWEAENYISSRLTSLAKKDTNTYKDIDKHIDRISKEYNIVFNDDQLKAIKNSMLENILIISGGPGTGKTTIVEAIVNLYKEINKLSYDELTKELVLLAPTGRASKRLASKTNLPASTIHSFLKWNKEQDRFNINEKNKSQCKFVIVDEASMIDVPLFNSLLKGLYNDTKLVLVGDYNQLPSVGAGQLLKDIIESDVIPVINLKILYRQKENSNIITLAHDINNGTISDDIFNVSDDLTLIETDDIIDNIINVSKDYIDKSYEDFQVLVPMYKGINGIDNINKALQELFNPKDKSKNEITIGDTLYRENDKVLQLINMPDERIFNGDIGTIRSIDKKEILIEFDTNVVRFTPSNYSSFKLGYAISIHKSQGSEFDTVILPVSSSYGKMLYKKLYYTAVTRSKRKLIIIGDLSSLKYASTNNISDSRNTSIKDKIIKDFYDEEMFI